MFIQLVLIMSTEANIRLIKVLRKLNIPLEEAVEILGNNGHDVSLSLSSRITREQHKILFDYHKNSSQKQNEKTSHFVKIKPEKSELIAKLKKICLGQPLNKLAVIFNIPNPIILKLGKSVIPQCTLEHRISNQDFEALKPTLENYVQEFIDDLPDKKVGDSKGNKYRPTIYTKSSKYFDHVRIIYTNM